MKEKHIWQNNFYIFRLIWEIAPSRVIFSFLLNLTDSAWDIYFSIIFYRYLLNGIIEQKSLGYLLLLVGIGAFLYFLRRILFNFYSFRVSVETDQYIYEALHMRVYAKATDVELAAFENTAFYEMYTKACLETSGRPVAVLDNLTSVFSTCVAIISMVIALVDMDSFALIFVIFPLTSQLLFGKKRNRLQYALDVENVAPDREKEYVNRTVYLKEYAKELRSTNIFSVLMRNYRLSSERITRNYKKYGIKLAALDLMMSLFNLYIPFFASCLYALYKITELGTMSIGEYSILSVAVIGLAGNLQQFADTYGKAHRDSLYIQNLRDFLSYESKISEDQSGMIPDTFETLEFKDVSFTYDGAEKPALEHLSFTIRAGQTVAIVGLNGAGKTTLVKLIMRLYDPQQGEIYYNGKNIKEYQVRAYRETIGTVFQDFRMFSLPVADNVLMGRADDPRRAETALRKAGIWEKIKNTPHGLQTVIGREFDPDGLELSGGEAQRIALARVFAGHAQIAILDEPSSALDPVAEYQMFENLRHAAEDKTTIFISHRLSSTQMADVIYLIDGHTIKEAGTHTELMARQGLYWDMYQKQASAYQGEDR